MPFTDENHPCDTGFQPVQGAQHGQNALVTQKSSLAQRRGAALLLVALTAIWGSTFVILKSSLTQIPPNQLMLWRFAIAALALLPFLRINPKLWLAGAE